MWYFILAVLFMASQASSSFLENDGLWSEIDQINEDIEEGSENPELELLFRRTVNIALSNDLALQFEELRNDAFASGDFTVLDSYVERAAPCIMVLILGESNNIGVNIPCFLSMAEPGTPERDFFDLALDGFYAQGKVGTAELPAWMTRQGSSSQAETDPELADMYAGIWEGMSTAFQGYYHSIAMETISILGGDTETAVKELDSYYLVYQNPFVMHIRIALDNYLNGSADGIYTGSSLSGELARYHDCLSDRFVVLSLDPSPMGGYEVLLISQARPYRIFDAWVYELPGGNMELRGFSENPMFSPGEVMDIADRYADFIEDHEHCL